jgi:hypothetical protein
MTPPTRVSEATGDDSPDSRLSPLPKPPGRAQSVAGCRVSDLDAARPPRYPSDVVASPLPLAVPLFGAETDDGDRAALSAPLATTRGAAGRVPKRPPQAALGLSQRRTDLF